MTKCLICGSEKLHDFYVGSIRMGPFGKVSNQQTTIVECAGCGARHLPSIMGSPDDYYRSGEYRNDLNQGNAVEKYSELTDDDQPHKLELLGMHAVRGQVVADVGAGAGPFLDLVKGIASRTIAIEPNESYHQSLRQRGHEVYPFAEAALPDCRGTVDLAVSFSVVEHVEKPREFLAEVKTLLKPGGRLLVSTPNAEDYLLEICPAYSSFFYRKVHLWYFTAPALTELARLAGFRECRILFQHRFDLSNALVWLRDQRPSGLGKIKVDARLDADWRTFLEGTGRSDYVYAILSA